MIKLHIPIFSFFIISLITGCDKNDVNNDFQTNVAPIEKRLCNLPGITSAKWKYQTYGGSQGISVPGPTGYRIWGYIKLEKEELSKFVSKFDDFKKDQSLHVDFQYLNENENYDWIRSQKFIDMTKRKLIVGSVWVCVEQGLIYFDLEGE